MQQDKLSYMQMQEWITTTYLMARARIFRLERDYPYLGFGRRHLMETLVATLSSAVGRVTSISFFPNSRKILMLDIPLRVPLVIHLNILSSSKILHGFDEGRVGWGIWLLQLFHGFLLVETFDL